MSPLALSRLSFLLLGSLSLFACGPDHSVTIAPNPPALTSIVNPSLLAATQLPSGLNIKPGLYEITPQGAVLTLKVEALEEAPLCQK